VENSNLTENELFRSAMDVDEVLPDSGLSSTGETIYAKTEEFSVSFYANLPVEVKQVLRNAGARFAFGLRLVTRLKTAKQCNRFLQNTVYWRN
jgi:hypothetical protein